MIAFLKAHKRVAVIALLWVPFCVFFLFPNRREGPFFFVLFSALFVMLVASQLFWIGCILDLGQRFIPGKPRRALLTAAVVTFVCLFCLAYAFLPGGNPARVTLRSVLIVAPFSWWFVGSMAGFFLVTVFWMVDRITRSAGWVYRRARKTADRAALATPVLGLNPQSVDRRRFLEQTAIVISAAPFAAAAYGLLYGRRDVGVTRQRIALARLPRAFEGFRIVHLSDFHIGPFMTADEIRRCVTIASGLNADLVVLTGDYIGEDAAAEGAVVRALSALKAPFGAFGCLGNHEFYTKTEESITRLLAAQGIRILRQERASIQSQGSMLNVIGVDYQSVPSSRDHEGHVVERYLAGSEHLVMPDVVNILLSHNPNTFDRAAELGIDLTLAGHSHGGQLSLEFVHRGLSPAGVLSPYLSGRYTKPGGQQLYVNRGIGTTGFPIRFGAPPEITEIELVRDASPRSVNDS